MSDWKTKRFWKVATVEEGPDGFAVLLDGRSVKTPAKTPLVLPMRALAEAVAAEWDAQEDVVDPTSMPFTQSANSAIDKVAVQFEEVAALISDYGDSDLICYRAEYPDGLVARQAEQWDPLIAWAKERYGAELRAISGIMHQAQDPQSVATLAKEINKLTNFQLTAIHDLVSISGSLVIGLAVHEGWKDPQTLWISSRVDELWQEQEWGEDDLATESATKKQSAFLHAARFLELSSPA